MKFKTLTNNGHCSLAVAVATAVAVVMDHRGDRIINQNAHCIARRVTHVGTMSAQSSLLFVYASDFLGKLGVIYE